MTTDNRGPLAGVKVLDLTRVISGPYATMMLADMGADIVKIEEPTRGDEMRWIRYRGRAKHDEDYFYACNRSKRSVGLNLKDPADQVIAQKLAGEADVLIENFSPGVAGRLGMGWERLSSANPRLIYCSISGFGQDGPYRSRPALDPIIQAISGVMSVTGYAEHPPVKVGAPIADVVSGMFAAYAIAAAIAGRHVTGRGQYLDVSMQDSMIAVLGPRMGESLQAGIAPARHGNATAVRVPADTYLTADDRYITMMVLNDTAWEPFCRALDKAEWFANPAYRTSADRVRHKTEINEMVTDEFRKRTAAEWGKRFEAHRIPYGFVNDYLQAVEDPQVRHRGLVREIRHPASGPIRVVGAPWKSSEGECVPKAPPRLGEHTQEVLSEWLGMAASEAAETEAQLKARHTAKA